MKTERLVPEWWKESAPYWTSGTLPSTTSGTISVTGTASTTTGAASIYDPITPIRTSGIWTWSADEWPGWSFEVILTKAQRRALVETVCDEVLKQWSSWWK